MLIMFGVINSVSEINNDGQTGVLHWAAVKGWVVLSVHWNTQTEGLKLVLQASVTYLCSS